MAMEEAMDIAFASKKHFDVLMGLESSGLLIVAGLLVFLLFNELLVAGLMMAAGAYLHISN